MDKNKHDVVITETEPPDEKPFTPSGSGSGTPAKGRRQQDKTTTTRLPSIDEKGKGKEEEEETAATDCHFEHDQEDHGYKDDGDGDGDPQQTNNTERPRLYSVFTVNQKRAMIATGSLASFFSPLSSSIYFPALGTIAEHLGVSTTRIDLTVTTYLVMQGVAPMMIAGFSDHVGRRPAYIICFTIYLAANLGLALQNSYPALMVLRFLQSGGSSGTVALANGLVGDMITSAERGTYIAFASLGSMLGPSLSPIIGGLISQYLDWHWIFWFLFIFAGIFFASLLLFLPETCRKVVGDGSIPPPPLNWSVSDYIRHRRRRRRGMRVNEEERRELRKNYKFQFPSPLPTLTVVFDKETALILLATGLTFACFYAVMTGATTSFKEVYEFNNIQIALMYIPIGAGGTLSAFTTGKIVDWNYRRHAHRQGIRITRNVRQNLAEFPIERARLEVAFPLFYLGNISMITYGWMMHRKVSLAAPIMLLFVTGYALNATSQVLNVLMVDLWPGRSAAATAGNNLFRCELGAAASAAIQPMSAAMGTGWAYTTLGMIAVMSSATLWMIMRFGMEWRQKKERRRRRSSSSSRSGGGGGEREKNCDG